jgi:hypothetical protein
VLISLGQFAPFAPSLLDTDIGLSFALALLGKIDDGVNADALAVIASVARFADIPVKLLACFAVGHGLNLDEHIACGIPFGEVAVS